MFEQNGLYCYNERDFYRHGVVRVVTTTEAIYNKDYVNIYTTVTELSDDQYADTASFFLF